MYFRLDRDHFQNTEKCYDLKMLTLVHQPVDNTICHKPFLNTSGMIFLHTILSGIEDQKKKMLKNKKGSSGGQKSLNKK